MFRSAVLVAILGMFSFQHSTAAMASMNTTSHNTTQNPTSDSAWSQSATSTQASQVAGDMSSGKCMCPAPVTCSTDNTTQKNPTSYGDDALTTPVTHPKGSKNDPTNTTTNGDSMPPAGPSGPIPPAGDNNSTTNAAATTEKSHLFTGLGLIAIASLVV